MTFLLASALLNPPIQSKNLTADERAVIEAVVEDWRKGSKEHYVFVYMTFTTDRFLYRLSGHERVDPCVKVLASRNAQSVFLDGFVPKWATRTASMVEARGSFRPQSPFKDEKNFVYVSLPVICHGGKSALIYAERMSRSQPGPLGGMMAVLRMEKVGHRWKVKGTVGRVEKA